MSQGPPIAARFDCDRCGRVASTIYLLEAGVPDPRALGERDWLLDEPRISIDGPVYTTRTGPEPGSASFESLGRAVSSGDPVALFSRDLELTPFWCPTCGLAYCGECWSIWVEMDEGFYDDTRGRCPAGHERMLDD